MNQRHTSRLIYGSTNVLISRAKYLYIICISVILAFIQRNQFIFVSKCVSMKLYIFRNTDNKIRVIVSTRRLGVAKLHALSYVRHTFRVIHHNAESISNETLDIFPFQGHFSQPLCPPPTGFKRR